MATPARTAAFDILLRLEQQGGHADELLHGPRLRELSTADRALATELVMGVLRWRSRLDAAIAAASSQPLRKLDPEVLTALRLGAYQLGHLRLPARAAVHESVELVKQARKRFATPFANAVLRKLAAEPARLQPERPADESVAALADFHAHPRWLAERWAAEFGEDAAAQICAYDQQPPPAHLRLRDLAVEDELRAEGVKLAPGSLLTTARRVVSGDLVHTRAFAEGRVFIQDEASQMVALLVGRGQRLLDCCAAPGGKAAMLAERNPTATVVACDLHPRRARTMSALVRAPNLCILAADAAALPFAAEFDRVLADVPCSGTGTLARNPEIKWRLRPEDLDELHARQVCILNAALDHLAPGGRLVYSTCSLEREEDEAVVEAALTSRSDIGLVDCAEELQKLKTAGDLAAEPASLARGKFLRTLPGVHPCDGFFAALLERR